MMAFSPAIMSALALWAASALAEPPIEATRAIERRSLAADGHGVPRGRYADLSFGNAGINALAVGIPPRGGFRATPHAEERLSRKPDLALLTVKLHDIVTALRENAPYLVDIPIVVLQNGLRGEELAATVVSADQIVSGVVALHAHYLLPGHVALIQSEGLLIGRPSGSNDAVVERIRAVLDKALPTSVTSNIRGARWTKLIIHLADVLPALRDMSFAQISKHPRLYEISRRLMREGIAVAERAKVRLASIPGTSIPLVGLVASDAAGGATTPARELPAAQRHANARGPAWQSVVRGRPTEVEFLNGDIVRMGKQLSVPTPLNARAVELMQRMTATGRHFSWQEVQHAFGMP